MIFRKHMPKKLSQEKAISLMMEIFPEYDYSKFKYEGTATDGTIRCPTHGYFENNYSKLKAGHGCQQCGIERRANKKALPESEAIRRMKEVSPQYDYTEFRYSGSSTKSTVICKKHGKFETSHDSIIGKHGCPSCKRDAISRRNTVPNQKAIAALSEKWPEYDFSKFTHTPGNKGVVVCRKHGEFSATYHDLMQNKGCNKCGVERRSKNRELTQDEAVSKMKAAMPQYDYSKFTYSKSYAKSTVICSKHGEFDKSYNHITNGVGCKKCSIEQLASRNTTPYSEFLAMARNLHGDKFNYIEASYAGMSSNIVAVCKTHGEFVLSCGEHIHRGQGCPSCKDKLFNPSKPGHLYICSMRHDQFGEYIGYGITVNVNRRFAEHERRCAKKGWEVTLIGSYKFKRGYFCREAENAIKTVCPPAGIDIRGFKRESTDLRHFDAIVQIAGDFYNKYGKESDIYQIR